MFTVVTREATITVACHQGELKTFWLPFKGAVVLSMCFDVFLISHSHCTQNTKETKQPLPSGRPMVDSVCNFSLVKSPKTWVQMHKNTERSMHVSRG